MSDTGLLNLLLKYADEMTKSYSATKDFSSQARNKLASTPTSRPLLFQQLRVDWVEAHSLNCLHRKMGSGKSERSAVNLILLDAVRLSSACP